MTTKKTRRREFLESMEQVVSCTELVALVQPHLPSGQRGRSPFGAEAMLHIHFMQQWFSLPDPVMEEALHDVPLFLEFAGLGGWSKALPDESTILRFQHVLERHELSAQILATANALLNVGAFAQKRNGDGCHADRSTQLN